MATKRGPNARSWWGGGIIVQVTGVTDEIWQAIEQADGLPHGRARIALLEELIFRADELHDAQLGTAIRVSLIPACLFGGEHQRVPGLLAWLLSQYDDPPAWFGPMERHSVLFSFNWATVGLMQYPDVPLAQLDRILGTMADRYRAAGESIAPVLRAQFLLTRHAFGPQQAQPLFEAWIAAEPSALSECEECERAEQVRQLAAIGRHQQAVELALPVIDDVVLLAGGPAHTGESEDGCAAHPVAMIAAVLGSLLETGQAERAAAEHIRAVRMLRDLPDDVAPAHTGRADHLLICARGGHLEQGLQLIENWLPWYARVGPPSTRLETAAAAGRVLRGLAETGHGHLVLTAAGDGAEPTTVDELGARLAREVRDLATRFDARNDTSAVGDQVERVLGATPLAELPLAPLSRSPRSARVRRPPNQARPARRSASSGPASGPFPVSGSGPVPGSGPASDYTPASSYSRDAGYRSAASNSLASSYSPASSYRSAAGYRPAPGSDPAAALPVNDLTALADTFDDGLKRDSARLCEAVLDTWRELRGTPLVPGSPDARAAARLDGWLALEELSGPELTEQSAQQGALAAAALATERLRSAGLVVEALLHEQAFLLAAAQAGRVDLSTAVLRIQQLTVEIGANAGFGDAGLALSRLVLIREVAAAAGLAAAVAPLVNRSGANGSAGMFAASALAEATPSMPKERMLASAEGADTLEAGLAALAAAGEAQLNHQQLRAVCRLLRLRAADEPPEDAITTLSKAVAVLPNGIRPLERALAGADLAGALHATDPTAALATWDRAIADAELAEATSLLGNLLAASATLRHALGNPVRAARDLLRAVPLLDEYGAAPLAAQARFDLSRVLLDLGRSYEAAEAAESALADLTDLLREQGIVLTPPGVVRDHTLDAQGDAGSAEIHLAGCSAFVAAEANAASGAFDRARELAIRSADWHRRNGNLIAQAEAWQLAARLGGPPAEVAADLDRAADLAEAGGDWHRAATCRRERITAIKDAEGLEAALTALAHAEAALGAWVESPAGRHVSEEEATTARRQLRWHRLAVAEQRARMLAVSGRFREAMAEVDGLEDEYQELGDSWSARDLKGLRGQLRAELNDFAGAIDDLRRAAEEAEAAGDAEQMHGLGERLAAVLDEAGRPGQAERAWQRFCTQFSPA